MSADPEPKQPTEETSPPPAAPPPVLRKRSVADVEATTGVRQRPAAVEAKPDLTEAEFRRARRSSRILWTATIGGPSVLPPQPDGVYAFTQNKKSWKAETNDNRFRRALYTKFFRSAPYPMLTTFDSPDFQAVCTQRSRSNTPLQSLTLANDAALFEICQGFASRIMKEIPGNDASSHQRRIRRAFVLCFSRQPSDAELKKVYSFQKLQVKRFNKNPEAAKAIAPSKIPAGYDNAAAASWTAVTRALMNTDEFITRE